MKQTDEAERRKGRLLAGMKTSTDTEQLFSHFANTKGISKHLHITLFTHLAFKTLVYSLRVRESVFVTD